MHQNTTVSSTAGFVVSGNIDTGNPSNASGWTNLATVYDEFRVVAAEIQYHPVDRYDAPLSVTTTVNYPPILAAIDRDSSATPATTTAIQEYESCRMFGAQDPFMLSWKADGIDEMDFNTTATPSSSKPRGFIWICANNAGVASTTFGYLFITFVVEFRGVNG